MRSGEAAPVTYSEIGRENSDWLFVCATILGSGAVRSRRAASNVARGIPAAAASGHKPSTKDRNAAASPGGEPAVDGLGGPAAAGRGAEPAARSPSRTARS